MITGDYPNTGRAIAEAIGRLQKGDKVHTGSDLNEMDNPTLVGEVMKTAVFARVSPEHKMRIIEALRANDQVVAMTGDGVNDAPAIKTADIGIAMGITGTDVAKGAADMVLTDDNYVSIVAQWSRVVIYANIRKFEVLFAFFQHARSGHFPGDVGRVADAIDRHPTVMA
jgi:Ca2+-transporting ATPase